jgi:hypothetical protein
MRLATIASALAIVLCVAIFGAIFLQRVSIPAPAPEAAPAQTTPTEDHASGSVATVTDNATESEAAPAAASQASSTPAGQAEPYPPVIPTSCSNPNALGISRVVEIDTTGGPGFGFEHFKAHDFLREGEVVLTFDDGPWPKNTRAVLAALAAHCTKAIFFPIGLHATYEPGLLKEVAAAGHAIGSHTWCHQDLSKTKGHCNVNGKVQTVEYNPIDEIEKGISAVLALPEFPPGGCSPRCGRLRFGRALIASCISQTSTGPHSGRSTSCARSAHSSSANVGSAVKQGGSIAPILSRRGRATQRKRPAYVRVGSWLFSNSGRGVKLSVSILAGFRVLSAVGACPLHDGVR